MLAQKLILIYGSRLALQFIQIAASVVVARIAGPTVLGTLAFGLAFVSMFTFIADFGTGPAHMKLISEGKDLGKCISTYLVIKSILTGLFFFAVLSVFLVQKYLLKVEFESLVHQYVILVFLVAITIQQLFGVPTVTFAARTEQAKYNIPDVLRTLLTQLTRIIVVVLGFGALTLAFSNLVATVITIPVILFLFKGYPLAHFDRQLAKQYFKISLPIMVIAMATTVFGYLDRVMLQFYTNSAQVGFYTAGYRIGALLLMIANSAGLLFFPVFSKAVSESNVQYMNTTIEKFERFSFLFIMPMVIFLSLYSDIIIRLLLGSQYNSSIPVMSIVNVAMFVMVVNMPYGNVITGMGFFRLAALINVANLLLFIGLMSILPNPRGFNLGPVGAAIAVLISNLFIGFLFRYFAKRKCSTLNLTKSVKFVVFGIINFSVFYALYTYFGSMLSLRFKIAFILVYFSITYSALIVLGWIERRDMHILKQLIDIGKISAYIKEEIRGGGCHTTKY